MLVRRWLATTTRARQADSLAESLPSAFSPASGSGGPEESDGPALDVAAFDEEGGPLLIRGLWPESPKDHVAHQVVDAIEEVATLI